MAKPAMGSPPEAANDGWLRGWTGTKAAEKVDSAEDQNDSAEQEPQSAVVMNRQHARWDVLCTVTV